MSKNKPKTSRIKTIVSFVTIVALVVLVYALRDQIKATYYALDDVNLWFISLMIPLQIINYHSYTKMYQRIYAIFGDTLPYKKLFKVQLELNFVNNIFPSGGVTGISYFSLRMRNLGAGAGKSTLVQFIKFALVFLSFQVMLAFGLLILAIGGNASNFLILVVTSLTTLLFVGTFMAAYIMGSRSRINSFFAWISKALNKFIGIFRKGRPDTINIEKMHNTFNELHDNYMVIRKDIKLLKIPFLWALTANISEVMTLYVVYMAFGAFVNIGAVTIAYAVSSFAGLISVLPGGIGIYEALMTATLAAAGISAALSLPVTVMYRILNSLIQLPLGGYFYYRNLHANKTK